MRYIIVLAILILYPFSAYPACDCGSVDEANPCTGTTISITVTGDYNTDFSYAFNSGGSAANCGQFANGDYWVSPASGESDVTFAAITSTGDITADVDPVMESVGLLDGTNTYGNYTSAQNIIPNLPQSYSGTNSILAAIQKNEAVNGNCGASFIEGECAASYNVITVMSSVPDNAGSDMIRPNITGESKVFLTWDDFDLTRLPDKSYLTGTDTAGLENIRERWSHNTEIIGLKSDDQTAGYSEGGRAFRAESLVDDYGSGMGQDYYNDLMTLFSDDNTLTEKKPALAAMLSFGLDLYHSVFNSPVAYDRFWGEGAGQSAGKFVAPALLASLMTSTTYKTNMADEQSHLSEYDERHGPHELGQINHGTDDNPLWGDNKFGNDATNMSSYWGGLWKREQYDTADDTGSEPSNREGYDPHGYIHGPPGNPGATYMAITLGLQRAMVATMFLMPEFCDTINYDRVTTYVQVLEDYGMHLSDDPCTVPDSREAAACAPYTTGENCVYYGITWGPEDGTGDCIEVDTNASVIAAVSGGYTQAGRFASQDGKKLAPSYTTAQVESNWSTIVTASSCERTASEETFLNIGSTPHFN